MPAICNTSMVHKVVDRALHMSGQSNSGTLTQTHSHKAAFERPAFGNFAAQISDGNPFDNRKMFVACLSQCKLVTYRLTYTQGISAER